MNYVFFKLYHMDSSKKINKNTNILDEQISSFLRGKTIF